MRTRTDEPMLGGVGSSAARDEDSERASPRVGIMETCSSAAAVDDATPCTPIVVGAIGGRGNGARHIGSDKGEWTIEGGEVGEPRGATEGSLISVVDGIEDASRSDARIRA